jgi:Transcriptional regulator, AbiEi antitoxin
MRFEGLPRQEAESCREPAHGALAELAKRQHGVVSVRQMIDALGYSRSAITRAADRGRLHRLYRGVYAVGHTNLSHHAQCLAAVLASGPNALLSHHSAAWLWGIARWSPIPVSVTSPTRRAPRPPIRLHHASVLTHADRSLQEGIPVTALARTLLDLAASVRSNRLRRLLERAEELRLFDLRPVEESLARSVGHPGAGRLRRALAVYRPAPFTRSGLERHFLALVEKAELPQPTTGFSEAGYELDVYWPEARFAVELDTYETHGSHEAFESDRLRQENLKLADIEMTRVTGHRLDSEPRQVIERVTKLLAQRRAQLRWRARSRFEPLRDSNLDRTYRRRIGSAPRPS